MMWTLHHKVPILWFRSVASNALVSVCFILDGSSRACSLSLSLSLSVALGVFWWPNKQRACNVLTIVPEENVVNQMIPSVYGGQ